MNIKLVLISLLISATVWTLSNLVQEATKEVQIQLQFVDPPKGLVLVNNPDTILKVELTAQGVDLLTSGMKTKNAVVLSLSEVNPKLRGKRYVVSLPSSYFKKELIKQLNVDDIGTEMNPDSLYFVFDDYIEKKLPIKVNTDLQFADSYSQKGKTILTPDSIWVKGPASELKGIDFIETYSQSYYNLDASIDFVLKCKPIGKGVSFEQQEVNVHVDIDQFTENSFMLPIQVKYDIPGIKIKTYPPEIKVTFQVALGDFDMVQDTSFLLAVTIDSLALLRKDPLIPILKRAPSMVRNVRFDRKTLDYVIIKE